jgi:hypothetical protein
MSPDILAISIPIVFLVGLFTAISLNIYYKYKARVATADHAPGESLEAWCMAEAMAKASVSRSAALRTGGFLAGAGIGMGLGLFIGRAPAVWQFFGSFYHYDDDVVYVSQITLYALFIIACAMLVGGLCMTGAYFVDRALEGKNRSQTTKNQKS